MPKSPVLIGIAGGSGSGKTHLARCIQAAEPESVSLVAMDQYFRTEVTGDAANVNFDHPSHLDLDLMLEHLIALKNGGSVRAPSYDFRTMTQTPSAIAVRSAPVILVDGLFVLADPFAPLLDLTFFLDVADDQRLLGRILRDVEERGAAIAQIVDRYQRFVRPSYHIFVAPTKHKADLVVDFTYRRALLAELLIHIVRDYVRGYLDLPELVRRIAGEEFQPGLSADEWIMPVSVDIRELAKAYPEASPALRISRVPNSIDARLGTAEQSPNHKERPSRLGPPDSGPGAQP